MNKFSLRSEALQILLTLLSRESGGNIDQKIDLAIHISQRFHKKAIASEGDRVTFPDAPPREMFGEFVPSGYAIYFLASDGARFLVAEFKSIPEAVSVCLSLNSYLKREGK
ncbi:hypothetical protein [Picosynechococcus sp. NKBG15041c]|uniref:hypothetical protein n=1 Tax=Picosynechococcus sp. NKBG15041c TaxID=1407650 RepID=UPI00040A82D0|nr:hypothetical protein [Picosynechococcus sp. NKBG15041c]